MQGRRFLVVALFAVSVALPARAVDIQEVVSPGGVIAWLVEDHSVPMIVMNYEFSGGYATDPVDRQGTAYLAAGLLNEGAGALDAMEYQKRLERSAIRMGFDAHRDNSTGSLKTLSEHAEEAFYLLGLALQEPRFDDDAVERVRSQVMSIQRSDEERPSVVAAQKWMQRAFDGHPYANRRKGTATTMQAITRRDLQLFVEGHFALDNLIIGVVGDISAEELGVLLDMAFGDLPEEADVPEIRRTTPNWSESLEIVERSIPQSVALFGLPGILRSDPDYYAAVVMNYVLAGGGFSSRLMEEVRRKRGLAYGVSMSLLPFAHSGVYLGSVATKNSRMSESMKVITDQIAEMANEGVTEQELANAKTYIIGSFPLSFDSRGVVAGQLTGIQRYRLGMNYIDRRNDYINSVTVRHVKRVAQRLLSADDLFWVIVGQPDILVNQPGNAPTDFITSSDASPNETATEK